MSVKIFLLINLGAFITAIGGVCLTFLRQGVLSNSIFNYKVLFDPLLYFVIFCYVVPIIIWTYLLKYISIVVLQPSLAVVYLYTFVFSYFLLKKPITTDHYLGAIMIATGIYFVSRGEV